MSQSERGQLAVTPSFGWGISHTSSRSIHPEVSLCL